MYRRQKHNAYRLCKHPLGCGDQLHISFFLSLFSLVSDRHLIELIDDAISKNKYIYIYFPPLVWWWVAFKKSFIFTQNIEHSVSRVTRSAILLERYVFYIYVYVVVTIDDNGASGVTTSPHAQNDTITFLTNSWQ